MKGQIGIITAMVKKNNELWGYEETLKDGKKRIYKLGDCPRNDKILPVSLEELEKEGYEVDKVCYEKNFFKAYPRWMIC